MCFLRWRPGLQVSAYWAPRPIYWKSRILMQSLEAQSRKYTETLNIEKNPDSYRTSYFRAIMGIEWKLRPKESFEGREKAVCLPKMNRFHLGRFGNYRQWPTFCIRRELACQQERLSLKQNRCLDFVPDLFIGQLLQVSRRRILPKQETERLAGSRVEDPWSRMVTYSSILAQKIDGQKNFLVGYMGKRMWQTEQLRIWTQPSPICHFWWIMQLIIECQIESWIYKLLIFLLPKFNLFSR